MDEKCEECYHRVVLHRAPASDVCRWQCKIFKSDGTVEYRRFQPTKEEK